MTTSHTSLQVTSVASPPQVWATGRQDDAPSRCRTTLRRWVGDASTSSVHDAAQGVPLVVVRVAQGRCSQASAAVTSARVPMSRVGWMTGAKVAA